MRKEGTGDPQNPDIAFGANVRMRELCFEKAPNPEVRFRGNTGRNSIWKSKREALPDRVREGVVYSDAGVRLWIASETDDGSGSELWRSSDEKTVEPEPENTEDKEKK